MRATPPPSVVSTDIHYAALRLLPVDPLVPDDSVLVWFIVVAAASFITRQLTWGGACVCALRPFTTTTPPFSSRTKGHTTTRHSNHHHTAAAAAARVGWGGGGGLSRGINARRGQRKTYTVGRPKRMVLQKMFNWSTVQPAFRQFKIAQAFTISRGKTTFSRT